MKNNNTALGPDSVVTTGHNNIFIGHNAGQVMTGEYKPLPEHWGEAGGVVCLGKGEDYRYIGPEIIDRCPYCGVLYEGREVQCTRCGGPR